MTSPAPLADQVHSDLDEAERADEAKTADDAPAPVHPEPEREVVVRDALGRDPYGNDQYGADGQRVEAEVGREPYELPSPDAAALQQAKERSETP